MRRLLTIGLALSLIAAACGDDDGADGTSTLPPSTAAASSTSTTAAPATTTTATTAPSGFTATSDDGRVTLDVPPGVLDEDPGITITGLAASDHPEDVAALDVVPWVYALEPGELEFAEPVRLTVEIPFAEFAPEGFDADTPLATMVVTGSGGAGWELAGDQVIRRDGDTVIVSGTTDHFSRVAVVPEQIFIETRFVALSQDFLAEVGVDFRWSNEVVLSPPGLGTLGFDAGAGRAQPRVELTEDGVALQCPPSVASLSGDLQMELILSAVESTSGATGIVSTPRLIGSDQTARPRVDVGITLACRPTIGTDGTVQLNLTVDHPGGDLIIPDGDFRGGLSAMLIVLAAAFPGLYVGLIRDLNGDGRIGPEDLMYPPVAATVDGASTTAVAPLYGYGDYFLYFLDGEPPVLQTEVMVRDGATILLGGLQREESAVPFLGDIPLLGRVFSDESQQSEDVELLVFLTPQIVAGGE